MKPTWFVLLLLSATFAIAQPPVQSSAARASMRQLMLNLIHPAANDILLFVNRGPAKKEDLGWAMVRRSALLLAESETLLMEPGRARDQGDWMKDARMLAQAGTAAYQAAQDKDFAALAALTDSLDASCTTCHRQYRPNVFPRDGGSK
jgi:cytochrome c553